MMLGKGRGGWALRLLTALALAGCGGNGLDVDALGAAFSRRGVGVVDGFVFVPTRQFSGEVSPHATIRVYALPRDGAPPVAVGQADATGYYRFDNLSLHQPYVVEAEEPFGGDREVRGLVTFALEAEDQRKNLNTTTTLSARVYELSDSAQPLSLDQIETLEELCHDHLADSGDDSFVATDEQKLDEAAEEVLGESFGSLALRVASDPTATVEVRVNGRLAGKLTSTPIGGAGQPFELADLVVGRTEIELLADGFVTDAFEVAIEANETAEVARTLVPQPAARQNQPPVIVDAGADPAVAPFDGGRVQIKAIVRDPDGDAVSVAARITAPDGAVSNVALPRTGTDVYGAEMTVPGNPTTLNRAYRVVVSAADAPYDLLDETNAPIDGRPVRKTFQFAVSGTVSPPGEPE